jgi:hypothetical protein
VQSKSFDFIFIFFYSMSAFGTAKGKKKKNLKNPPAEDLFPDDWPSQSL